jgi:hypothetical protein
LIETTAGETRSAAATNAVLRDELTEFWAWTTRVGV